MGRFVCAISKNCKELLLLSIVQAPTWEKADRCVLCGSAFFWNFRGMWSDKRLPGKVVVRQVSHMTLQNFNCYTISMIVT